MVFNFSAKIAHKGIDLIAVFNLNINNFPTVSASQMIMFFFADVKMFGVAAQDCHNLAFLFKNTQIAVNRGKAQRGQLFFQFKIKLFGSRVIAS